jgi:hypothetical protein
MGPGQQTSEIYDRIRPALQLITLWLTEDYPLLWFSHLTFGERRRNPAGQTYIAPTPYSSTPAALEIVKGSLLEFAKTITFMFAPDDCKERERSAWGVTWPYKSDLPSYQRYKFAPVQSYEGVLHPIITMHRAFDEFFRKSWSGASLAEKYKGLFMFACVLGHEIGHGYAMFIHGGEEPLWSTAEKQTELRFSWEANVLGHALQQIIVDGRFHHEIHATKVREISTLAERAHVVKHLKEGSKANLTARDAHGNDRKWQIIDAFDFRGADVSNNAQGFAASIHIIPVHWMVSWFQKDIWASLKMRWDKHGVYAPFPLGKTFMIIYEKGNKGAQVHRPLYPNNAVDAEILRRKVEY